jgi:hypothetical protein
MAQTLQRHPAGKQPLVRATLEPDTDGFLVNALSRVAAREAGSALEIFDGPVSPLLSSHFASTLAVRQEAVFDLPAGEFHFVLATRGFDAITSHAPAVVCFREASRTLREGGLFCARLNHLPDSPIRFSMGELAELARDHDFQIHAIEGAGSKAMWLLWRKRAPGWRLNLADQAALASARIVRVRNSWDNGPVVPSHGRYAAITITVAGLPMDMDVLDLEVLAGGVRATATSIGDADARGEQEIHAILPNLEQTGLLPVELRWFGERLTAEPAYVRVIPPGPIVPRIVRITGGASRTAGITISIEELARPDEFSASIEGMPVWGLDALCTDPAAQSYDVRFQVPDEIPAGVHEVRIMVGRRKMAPIAIEVR